MIKGADNISRKPYLGSTEIKQAWLGTTLVYPESVAGMRRFSSLGDVDYYWDMGDGIHYATDEYSSSITRIYRYNDKGDDTMIYESPTGTTYICCYDGFFSDLVDGSMKFYRVAPDDTIEEWTKDNFLTSVVNIQVVGEYTYLLTQSDTSTASCFWYAASLDYENHTIRKTSTSKMATGNYFGEPYWMNKLSVSDGLILFEDTSTMYKLYSTSQKAIRKTNYQEMMGFYYWGWQGVLNDTLYGIGQFQEGKPYTPRLYTITSNASTISWTNVSLSSQISDKPRWGGSWDTFHLNGEDMVYINSVSSSITTYTPVLDTTYLLRIVDGQPVVKKYESTPYLKVIQFPGQNLFLAASFVYRRTTDSYYFNRMYIVTMDNNYDFQLVEDLGAYSKELPYNSFDRLPVWKYQNKIYMAGLPFKYIPEDNNVVNNNENG